MFDDRHGADLLRNEFLEQLAVSAELKFLMLGFFDSKSGDVTETWMIKADDCPPDACRNLMRELRRALSVQTAIGAGQGITGVRKQPLWLRAGDYRLAIGMPVADLFPIMVVSTDDGSENPTRKAMLRLALAYVQQQLTETVYSRSPWPEGLVEATLETLSLRFLLVTAKAEIRRDGRLNDTPGPSDPAWMVCNRRLTLEDDKERKQLHDAIEMATGTERRTSIIPVSTLGGRMRLAVVAPLSRSVPPMALVLFEHSGTDHAALREHFFTAHGLTMSERRVAHLLLDGETLNEAAEATELSLATVRSYLKRIFVKTGTHRQSELVALYYRSILPVGTSIAKAEQNLNV